MHFLYAIIMALYVYLQGSVTSSLCIPFMQLTCILALLDSTELAHKSAHVSLLCYAIISGHR